MSEIDLLRYKKYDWEKPFDPGEYCNNNQAIIMLYEKYLTAAMELEEAKDKIEIITRTNTNLRISNSVFESKRRINKNKRWVNFGLQFISLVSSGIGINMVSPPDSIQNGWYLIALAGIIELILLFSTISENND